MKFKLDKFMKDAGLSNSELARITGLSNVAIGQIRQNKRDCTCYTLGTIAKALGCTIDDLIEEVS